GGVPTVDRFAVPVEHDQGQERQAEPGGGHQPLEQEVGAVGHRRRGADAELHEEQPQVAPHAPTASKRRRPARQERSAIESVATAQNTCPASSTATCCPSSVCTISSTGALSMNRNGSQRARVAIGPGSSSSGSR